MPSLAHGALAHKIAKVYVGLLLVLSLLPSGFGLLRFHDSLWLRWTGVVVASSGIVLLLWAMSTLGEQYSPCGRVYLPEKIVTHGPYRWLRHPVYVGNWLFLLGTFLATGSLWMLGPLVFYTVALSLQAKREESQLLEAFSEYRRYQQKTRWLV
jgi:protein-S-isoprenylcysteine O-methyltransferase Ste14